MSEAQYGVQTQNKYFIFDDEDEDPLEAAQRQLEEVNKAHEKKKKEEKKSGGTKKTVKPIVATKQKSPPLDTKEAAQPPMKRDREGDKENKPGEMNQMNERGRGRGRGEYRGPREFRGRGRGRGDFEGGDRGGYRGNRGGGMRGGRGGAPFGGGNDMPPRFQSQGFEPNGEMNDNNNAGNNLADRFGESQPFRGRVRGRGFRGDRGDGFRGRGGGGYRGGRGGGEGFVANWNDNNQNDQVTENDNNWQNDSNTPNYGGNFGEMQEDRAPGQRPYRGRGRGGRMPRGDFQGRGYRGTRSHRYERHSGSDVTGVKSVDKREGRGSHNWGDTEDAVIAAENEQLNTTGENETEIAVVKEPMENEEGVEAQAEPESQQLTYDEWLKSQGKREKPQFNIRKAGEGEDSKGAKNYVPLTREKVNEEEAVASDEEDHDYHQRKTAKQLLAVDVKFSDEAKRGSFGGPNRGGRGGDRGFGGRGGMGGGRGRGGRGGASSFGGGGGEYRGGRGGGRRPREEFNLEKSEEAFPELGAA